MPVLRDPSQARRLMLSEICLKQFKEISKIGIVTKVRDQV
jgi:hypothetical protein